MRAYKIRRFQNGKNRNNEPFYNYALTVPTEIAEQLPKGMQYTCEATDEGLLFRPVTGKPEKPKLPEWASAKPENGSKKTPARTRMRPGVKAPA